MRSGPLQSRTAAAIVLLFILATVSLFGIEDSKPLSPALQNQILRAYFEKQYQSMGLPSEPQNRLFKDQYVDSQIEHFLQKIRQQVKELEVASEAMLQFREEWKLTPSQAGMLRWKQSLDRLADRAGSLRKTLAFVFVELKSADSRKISVDPTHREAAYDVEVDFIREQIRRAIRQVDDYLFELTNTVRLDEIQGENMLVNLKRAQEMADRLKERL